MSRGANGHNMVKGSVDYATFENQVLRLDLARTDDVDNVESALKFKDVRAYREYFQPLLIRELRANIRSILQENAQSLLVCPCTSSKILFGSYSAPTPGASNVSSGTTITSPVYAAAQYQTISEAKKPSCSTFFLELNASQHIRPDPNADSLDQYDLVSIDLTDRRSGESGGVAAVRPPSPSGIVLSKHSVLGIVHRVRANKIEVQLLNSYGHPTLKELVCEGTSCTLLRIDSLVTFRRKFAALQRMGSSPLCEGLLDPSILGNSRLMGHYLPASEHLGVLTPRFKDWLHDCLNSCQWDCVQRICSNTSPRVSLIQGPPGTGKTRVTLALLNCFILMRFHSHSQSLIKVLDVQNASKVATAAAAVASDKTNRGMVPVRPCMQPIHRNHVIPRPHILVCAPSNAAVDELLLRVTSCSTELRDFGCNVFRPAVVRVGNSDMMSDSIMCVSLDSQVETYLYMKSKDAKAKLDEYASLMAKKQFEILLLEQEYRMLPHLVENFKKVLIDLKEDEHNLELQIKRLKVCLDCTAECKADTLAACHKSALHTARSVLESSLLDQAMVVFTTLTSAGRDSLATVNFDVVLIDEACQSVELETLIPLCLGAKRCVLIGDPQQLPATVMSSSALYRRSLFDRLQASGVELFMLTQQYRMHSDICLFPSQYFYGGNLICDDSVAHRQPLPKTPDRWLPPFVVFNISSSSTRSGSGFMNKDEASFTQLYIQHILRRHSDIKLANFVALTPYRAQVRAIKAVLPNIRVSTVDSFQGQESDFVIFSAVRAGSTHIGFVKDMQRLNVAITRAKHALIIICDVRAMESNEGWKNLIRSANERGLLSHVPSTSNNNFKQRIDQFLSKTSPFPSSGDTAQRTHPHGSQHDHAPSTSRSDTRLQPSAQISNSKVPLPPHSNSASLAKTSSNHNKPSVHGITEVSHGVQGNISSASRPQKRATTCSDEISLSESSPQSQHANLKQSILNHTGEQRIADLAVAEQQRLRLISETQRRADSPSQLLTQALHQHPPPSHHLQPPLKRERLNDFPNPSSSDLGRVSSVPYVPFVYNPPAQMTPVSPGVHFQPIKKPPPPPGAPPVDPSASPLKEQILAVERLFSVPSLLATLAGCRSWSVAKTNAVAFELSRTLHTDMSMTYDYEALRVFISRFQSGSYNSFGAAGHSLTQLPHELTMKLVRLINNVVATHSRMN